MRPRTGGDMVRHDRPDRRTISDDDFDIGGRAHVVATIEIKAGMQVEAVVEEAHVASADGPRRVVPLAAQDADQ